MGPPLLLLCGTCQLPRSIAERLQRQPIPRVHVPRERRLKSARPSATRGGCFTRNAGSGHRSGQQRHHLADEPVSAGISTGRARRTGLSAALLAGNRPCMSKSNPVSSCSRGHVPRGTLSRRSKPLAPAFYAKAEIEIRPGKRRYAVRSSSCEAELARRISGDPKAAQARSRGRLCLYVPPAERPPRSGRPAVVSPLRPAPCRFPTECCPTRPRAAGWLAPRLGGAAVGSPRETDAAVRVPRGTPRAVEAAPDCGPAFRAGAAVLCP
jgi:hypothetical protein